MFWNGLLGWDDGVSVAISKNENFMRLYDKPHGVKGDKPDYRSKEKPKLNDIVSIHFDFIKDKVIFYHNNNEITNCVLDKKIKLIPAFTFYMNGDQIEVVQWDFIY